jgi:hypothetical protein
VLQNSYRYGIAGATVFAAIFSLMACGTSGATGGRITPTKSASIATVTRTQTAAAISSVITPLNRATAFSATQTRTVPVAMGSPIPSTDFAFTFDAGWCGIGKLDLFNGTFTTRIRTDKPDKTVNLILSQAEMATIYRKMIAINFFDYPEQYETVIASGSLVTAHAPANTYQLNVRDDGRTKSVVWTDNISSPTTIETENLRTLIRLIEQTIVNRPEYKNLPQRNFGCA